MPSSMRPVRRTATRSLSLLLCLLFGRRLWRLLVEPPLHATDGEYDIVSEDGVLLDLGHPDAEHEHVVYEGVDGLVGQRSPRQVLHRLQAVVHEYQRRHD